MGGYSCFMSYVQLLQGAVTNDFPDRGDQYELASHPSGWSRRAACGSPYHIGRSLGSTVEHYVESGPPVYLLEKNCKFGR